jgi:putative transposase
MFLQDAFWVSAKRACNTVQLQRSTWHYQAHGRDSTLLTMRIKELAYTRLRYGYMRILWLLRKEGFKDNHKRVYRIYRQEGLNLRMKRHRRNRMAAQRLERVEVQHIHQIWSMGFVADPYVLI